MLLPLLPHTAAAFPGILTGRLPHLYLSRPAQRSLAFRPACSLDRQAIRFTRGFDGFVTSSVAPIATGWSDPLPGGILTHWKSPPFHGAQLPDSMPPTLWKGLQMCIPSPSMSDCRMALS